MTWHSQILEWICDWKYGQSYLETSGFDTGIVVIHVWTLRGYGLNELYTCLILWYPFTKAVVLNDTKTPPDKSRVQPGPCHTVGVDNFTSDCLAAAEQAYNEGSATTAPGDPHAFLE